jgi:hypothetical protein
VALGPVGRHLEERTRAALLVAALLVAARAMAAVAATAGPGTAVFGTSCPSVIRSPPLRAIPNCCLSSSRRAATPTSKFVGTQTTSQTCAGAASVNDEGHSGYGVQSVANVLAAYLAVIAEFRKQNVNVIFFVSKINKLSPAGCSNCLGSVAALAAALTEPWAAANSTPTSPIHLVDVYDFGFDPTNLVESSDGFHPTPAGAAKMATATFNGVVAHPYF